MKPTDQSAVGHPVNPKGEWSTGLCDCFSDVPNCCLTCFCPCVTFGQIAEIVDGGSSSCCLSGAIYCCILACTGLQWIYSCTYRSKMRHQFGMPASTCGDCCVHYCCQWCALCQEYRELEHRGFDPRLGWQGNLNRQNQVIGMGNPPTVQGSMTR